MFIIDRIKDVCLFCLEDEQVNIVTKVLRGKLNIHVLEDMYQNAIQEVQEAIGEIIDLIDNYLLYGNIKIENVIFTFK